MVASRDLTQAVGGVLKHSEVLAQAADLIEPDGAWTQFARARNAKGYWERVDAPSASCWCIIGAVQRAAGRGEEPIDAYSAPELRWVSKVIRKREPSQWNDAASRKQEAVVAALRKASELAKAEGQ